MSKRETRVYVSNRQQAPHNASALRVCQTVSGGRNIQLRVVCTKQCRHKTYPKSAQHDEGRTAKNGHQELITQYNGNTSTPTQVSLRPGSTEPGQ